MNFGHILAINYPPGKSSLQADLAPNAFAPPVYTVDLKSIGTSEVQLDLYQSPRQTTAAQYEGFFHSAAKLPSFLPFFDLSPIVQLLESRKLKISQRDKLKSLAFLQSDNAGSLPPPLKTVTLSSKNASKTLLKDAGLPDWAVKDLIKLSKR